METISYGEDVLTSKLELLSEAISLNSIYGLKVPQELFYHLNDVCGGFESLELKKSYTIESEYTNETVNDSTFTPLRLSLIDKNPERLKLKIASYKVLPALLVPSPEWVVSVYPSIDYAEVEDYKNEFNSYAMNICLPRKSKRPEDNLSEPTVLFKEVRNLLTSNLCYELSEIRKAGFHLRS